MTTRVLTPAEIEVVAAALSYVPTRNVRGLGNGSAAILYDNWCPNSVCVHSWVPEPRFLTKGFMREIWRYPFEHVDWVIGVTPGDNAKALAFNKRIGFNVAYVLKDGFAKGVDQVFQTAHYSDCRWFKRPGLSGDKGEGR